MDFPQRRPNCRTSLHARLSPSCALLLAPVPFRRRLRKASTRTNPPPGPGKSQCPSSLACVPSFGALLSASPALQRELTQLCLKAKTTDRDFRPLPTGGTRLPHPRLRRPVFAVLRHCSRTGLPVLVPPGHMHSLRITDPQKRGADTPVPPLRCEIASTRLTPHKPSPRRLSHDKRQWRVDDDPQCPRPHPPAAPAPSAERPKSSTPLCGHSHLHQLQQRRE